LFTEEDTESTEKRKGRGRSKTAKRRMVTQRAKRARRLRKKLVAKATV
jgi:hypothetical protein